MRNLVLFISYVAASCPRKCDEDKYKGMTLCREPHDAHNKGNNKESCIDRDTIDKDHDVIRKNEKDDPTFQPQRCQIDVDKNNKILSTRCG